MIARLELVSVLGQITDNGLDNIDISLGLGGSAVGAFLTTLLVGAILIALAPTYTDQMTSIVFGEPIDSFLYGLFVLLLLIVVSIVLVITILGILLVVPLLVAAYLVWAVGSTIAFLAIGRRLLDHDDWLYPLLLGAAINGGLALTGIGGIVSFCVGAIGFGAVIRDWRS